MLHRSTRRLRSLLAVVLFAMGGGAEQFIDAVLFHGGVAPIETARVNAGDHCHAERCELGAPIATPPPVDPLLSDGRFEPPIRRTELERLDSAPRALAAIRAHGTRAPPSIS